MTWKNAHNEILGVRILVKMVEWKMLCLPHPMTTLKLKLNYRTIKLENHLKTS